MLILNNHSSLQIVFLLVDHFHTKHPKLRKDMFWDEMLPQLPQTKLTLNSITNPQLGSAFNLEVNPADAEFLPMDTLLEEDNDANVYSSDSVKQTAGVRYRPSFLMNILNSNFGQSIRRRSTLKTESFRDAQGHVNPAFAVNNEKFAQPKGNTPTHSRKSSLVWRSPTHSRASSISFHPSSISRHRHKMYDVQQADANSLNNGSIPECEGKGMVSALNAAMAPVVGNFENTPSAISENIEQIMQEDNPPKLDSHMPPIPEEPSRVVSTISLDPVPEAPNKQMDDVQNLVAEASKVLEELNRVVTAQGHRKDCELKGYESCCSLGSDDSSSDEGEDLHNEEFAEEEPLAMDSVVIDMQRDEDRPQSSFS
ncbi:bestrophin homolog [Trichonephila clavipes]|nr:bestrophin homolog [Trichonephila clavipes]